MLKYTLSESQLPFFKWVKMKICLQNVLFPSLHIILILIFHLLQVLGIPLVILVLVLLIHIGDLNRRCKLYKDDQTIISPRPNKIMFCNGTTCVGVN